ncbi:MAG: hypothetical protein GY851_08610 [bacterium]|nr:hypothetical protein [bacterium]
MGFALLLAMTANTVCAAEAPFQLVAGETCPDGTVEVRGVAAGLFDPALWREATPHLVPDARTPLLAPLEGKFRNIYAPSAVRLPDGWRVFYGAWDGVATGNDRIYCVDTPGFLDFGERRTVIEHGVFIHVCNVNAFRNADGSYEMACTTYPDPDGLNKPGYFTSPDGKTWNGTPMPYPATYEDIVDIQGYDGYAAADINGMNVIFREGDKLRLYFNNFKDMGRVYRATATEGKTFQFEGPTVECPFVVNDVKKFGKDGAATYLMGLHMNREGLWYSVSDDGMAFEPPRPLLTHLGDADRYIVAIGWVADQERVLGVLYGAGAVPALNENRIFARWLQRRVVFVPETGDSIAPAAAVGPDRQRLPVAGGKAVRGRFQVFAEDGVTLLGVSALLEIAPGQVYEWREAG